MNHTADNTPTSSAPALQTPAIGVSSGVFTASQIARAAGITRQAVAKGIERIEPTARVSAAGKETDAWAFHVIPFVWQENITRRAVKRGFENAEKFLASLPLSPWKPSGLWDRVAAKEQIKASKLKNALARALTLRSNPDATPADVELAGLEDFKKEFGFSVSNRHWRRLLDRTIERDGGEENWEHLALYLDDRAFDTTPPARVASPTVECQHQTLAEAFCKVVDRANLTAAETEFLWRTCIEHYGQLTGSLADSPNGNQERRRIKAALLEYLFKAFPSGTLCASFKSLKRRFDEKLSTYHKCGAAALKSKHENSGRVAKKLCASCRPLMMGASVDFDKNYRQAWRQLHQTKKLCEDCRAAWTFNIRTHKSYCPKSVIEDIRAEVELAWMVARRGPKFTRLRSPYVKRNWSDTAPGDYSVMDDMTPDTAVYGSVEMPLAYDDSQSGKPFVGRMEALFSVDERTDYPLAFVIILGDPETHYSAQRKATYNQANQRQLLLRQHDSTGLPHIGLKLENGPWKNYMMDGEKLDRWQSLDVPRFENGLAEMGIKIRHALPGNPRSKIIERVFAAVHNRMRCHPGYLGNNERMDRRELTQDFLARVKRGQEHPGNELLSVSQFTQLLSDEFMSFADEPQNGERLPGVSPREAFYSGIDGHPGYSEKPLRQFASSARFLLSTHEKIVTVRDSQILLNLPGKVRMPFSGEELIPYHRQQVLVRISIEEPEFLSVRAPDGKMFMMKARVQMANTESKEQLAEMARWRANWSRAGKIIADKLPHPFTSTIARDGAHSDAVRNFGGGYDRQIESLRAERGVTERKVTRARQKVRDAGFNPATVAVNRNPDSVAESAVNYRQGLAELKRKEQLDQEESTHE